MSHPTIDTPRRDPAAAAGEFLAWYAPELTAVALSVTAAALLGWPALVTGLAAAGLLLGQETSRLVGNHRARTAP